MSRLTFYRKYRSQTFAEIIGQEHITQTLQNAIKGEKYSHAYIFSGPRGTGKTSIARIFAKALNTYQHENQYENLSSSLCERITKGLCVDIIEIDAASNTGVDNIRDINEKVNFTPVECKTKFYIIDEAHMLSSGAFNALLKTLEEPPSHTIFILATTEPHKIPITIHSRCQHLHFRNLKNSELQAHLKKIAEKEKITISESAIDLIARNSSGCMRDALSLFDQIFSFQGNHITVEHVENILGASNQAELFNLLKSLMRNDQANIVRVCQKMDEEGVNPLQLIADLIKLCKDCLLFKANAEQSIPFKNEVKEIVSELSLLDISYLLEIISKVEAESRNFSNPSLLLQIRLLQFTERTTIHTPSKSAQQFLNKQDNANTKRQRIENNKPQNGHSMKNETASKSIQKEVASIKIEPKHNEFSTTISSEKKENPVSNQTIKEKSQQAENQTMNVKENSKETHEFNTAPDTHPLKKDPSAPKKTATESQSSAQDSVSQWKALLLKIKTEKPALYTILRSSKIIEKSNEIIKIKLNQTFKFFYDKINEPDQINLLNKIASEIWAEKCLCEIVDQENDSKSNTKPTLNENSEPPTPTSLSETSQESTAPPSTKSQPSNEQVSINTIVEMFSGNVL